MTGQGWATGSDIITKPSTKEYREGWERIFGKKDITELPASFFNPKTENKLIDGKWTMLDKKR